MNIDDDDRATQRLASRNHSTPALWPTLRHDAAERTGLADDWATPTRLSRLHLPVSMAGRGPLGHARARKRDQNVWTTPPSVEQTVIFLGHRPWGRAHPGDFDVVNNRGHVDTPGGG